VSAASTNATTTSSSGGGGGGGGGGGSSVSYFANTAIAAITSISANSTQAISIRNATASDISTIAITTNNRIGSATLTVLKIATKPSGVSDVSGNVYRYIQIDKTNITDSYVTSVKITFFVENSWITANNIDDSTIALYRYANGAWTKLSTTKTNADSTYTYYEATSPGLSVFAIIGEKKTTTPPAAKPATGPVCGNNACESGENYQSCPQDCPKPVLCGNGVLDPDEECEGTDVPGQTCETRGYTGGTLKCTNCRVDESQCITKTPLGEMTKETWDMSIIMVIAVLVIVVIAGWFYCHGKHAFPKRKKNPWER
jgi:PGF-pre-PGF domain-containing protein